MVRRKLQTTATTSSQPYCCVPEYERLLFRLIFFVRSAGNLWRRPRQSTGCCDPEVCTPQSHEVSLATTLLSFSDASWTSELKLCGFPPHSTDSAPAVASRLANRMWFPSECDRGAGFEHEPVAIDVVRYILRYACSYIACE